MKDNVKDKSGSITMTFAGVAHTYAHLFVLLFATVVLVLENQWHMSYGALFAVSLPGTVMFGAAALPAGWLGDRWSASGMMALFFLGVGASSILTGLANGPWMLGIGLTLVGTFAAIYHPVGIPWLVKHAVNRGRALGINGVMGSAGTAGAALVAGALTYFFGWRSAFLVPGAVCLLTGLLFVIALRRGLIVEREEDAAPQPEAPRADVRRAFMVLAVTMLCTGLIYQSTAFALPKIFDERLSGLLHGNVFGVGGLVTICYICSALAQIAGGELADRYALKNVYVAVQFLQLPVLAVAFVLYNPVLIGVAGLMIGLNTAGQPAENALLARYTPAKWRGRAFGAKFVLTLGVSTGGVALIPILYELTGSLSLLFVVLFVFAAIAGIVGTRLPRDGQPQALAAAAQPAE